MMKPIWRGAVERFVLNHLEQMDHGELARWLEGNLNISANMESTLWSLREHKQTILRELNALSPAEVFDMYQKERPGNRIKDKNKAIVRIGEELEAMKTYLMSI